MHKKITFIICIMSGPLLCVINKPAQPIIIEKNANLISNCGATLPQVKKTTKKNLKENTKTITIRNSITKDMTGYTYFGTTYYPKFNIRVNNTIVEPGKEITIKTTNNTIDAQYEYSFAKGLYKGKEIIKINIASSRIKNGELTFCWHNKKRVKLKKTLPV